MRLFKRKARMETGIALFRYTNDMPDSRHLFTALEVFEDIVAVLGYVPTYFGADNSGEIRSKYTKYNGRRMTRVLKEKFNGYQSCSLVVNPEGSDAPAYDNFVDLGYGFSPELKEIYLSAWIAEPQIALDENNYDYIIRKFASLLQWNVGFVDKKDRKKRPGLVLLGASPGTLNDEEYRRLSMWYNSGHEQRKKRIRDIYTHNIVSSQHLNFEFIYNQKSLNLRQFIETNPFSELSELTSDLWLWKVPEEKRELVREDLKTTGILITEPNSIS